MTCLYFQHETFIFYSKTPKMLLCPVILNRLDNYFEKNNFPCFVSELHLLSIFSYDLLSSSNFITPLDRQQSSPIHLSRGGRRVYFKTAINSYLLTEKF